MLLYLLRAVFTDHCTYTNDVFAGVFRSRELAEASKKEWIQKHKETPNDWYVDEIHVDEVF